MPEYLDDPSVLTKDKLKSELLAHNVELPTGNPTKDVYVQLYLTNLTSQNKKHAGDIATTWDAFSSDEELPPPVVSSRSRSSGRVSFQQRTLTSFCFPSLSSVCTKSHHTSRTSLFFYFYLKLHSKACVSECNLSIIIIQICN